MHPSDPIAAYMQDIMTSTKLTAEEEKTLARRIRKGDKHALHLLVQANLKFVVAVCRNYGNQGLPMADLINEGNLGLMEAARRFDETKKFRFISYGVWWIRQAILNALAKQSRPISVPPSTTATIHKINVASKVLAQRLGRQPSPEELELETGLRSQRIRECQGLESHHLSLNYPSAKDGNTEFQDALADESESRTERIIEVFETGRVLDALMNRLDGHEREVLSLYFGIGNGDMQSLADIANRFGVSRECIRQLKKKGILKLRRAFKAESSVPNLSHGRRP